MTADAHTDAVFTLSFDLPAVPHRTQTFTAPQAPFNPGTWQIIHSFTEKAVRVECMQVLSTVKVKSVTLKSGTRGPAGASDERSADSGLQAGATFPPAENWSLRCVLEGAVSDGGWCKIEVGLDDQAKTVGPVAEPTLGAMATRNTGERGV